MSGSGTEFNQDQTPTIEDCAAACVAKSGCEGFSYGTQNGEKNRGGTSDGVRANDCRLNKNLNRSSSNRRWDTYSVSTKSSSCAACPGGQYSDTTDPGSQQCTQSPAGFAASQSVTCVALESWESSSTA